MGEEENVERMEGNRGSAHDRSPPRGSSSSSMCVTLVYYPSHVTVCESHGVVGAHVEQHGYCQSRPASHSRITARPFGRLSSLSLGLPSEFFRISLLFLSLSFPLASFLGTRLLSAIRTRTAVHPARCQTVCFRGCRLWAGEHADEVRHK